MRRLKESLENVEKLQKFIGKLEEEGLDRAAKACEKYIFDLFNYQRYPCKHWRRIRTTNMIERINKEIKRRSKVAEAFPSDESLLRVAVAILIDINEEWFLSRRYLSIDYQAV